MPTAFATAADASVSCTSTPAACPACFSIAAANCSGVIVFLSWNLRAKTRWRWVGTSCTIDITGYITAPPMFASSIRLLQSEFFVSNEHESCSEYKVPKLGGRNSPLSTTGVIIRSPDSSAGTAVLDIFANLLPAFNRLGLHSPHLPSLLLTQP